MSFSWVPFYRELAGKVLEFEDRQDELIVVLREMQDAGLKTVPIEDDLSRTERVPFTEIDPFTFMATFSRSGDKTATVLCDWIRTKWSLKTPTPSDFEGRANVDPRGGASWFFTSSEHGRTPEAIPLLWELARFAISNNFRSLDPKTYEQFLEMKNMGVVKLSTGLFWFNPDGFLPLTGPILPFLKHRGIAWNNEKLQIYPHRELSEYQRLCDYSTELQADFKTISANAWRHSKNLPPLPPQPQPMPKNKTLLNQILYGPPGTGKTYNSIRRAVEIIDGKVGDDPKSRFKELRKAGQIEFVTFHQSFSYEEFIEGLRPLIGEGSGQVSYEIRDGVLKKIALEAIYAGLLHNNGFEQAWELFMVPLTADADYEISGLTDKSRFSLQIDGDTISGENILSLKSKSNFSCEKEQLKKLCDFYLKDWIINSSDVKKVLPEVVGEGAFVAAVYNAMGVLLLADYQNSAKKWLDGSSDCEPNTEEEIGRYVLIIDEINRGNISKILGELITLLEDDKRIGMENELRLTLPTSGETFALPPNLYILGTMNTSDKSLAQLDVALRRRFDFEEMAPNLALCDGFAAQIPVLQEFNHRLEWALDREHRLGHAYFMKVDSEAAFNAVFRFKVLPLLLEYFPHDFATLGHVLGAKGNGFLIPMTKPDGFASGTKYRWWFENGVEEFSAFAQLKSNYGL